MRRNSLSHFIKKKQYVFTESWLRGYFWRLWLSITKRQIVVEGRCIRCGECCRSLCIEGYHGWLKTKSEFEALIKMRPEYERFVIIGSAGGCLLFTCTKVCGDGSCADYENRPNLCRTFPHQDLLISGAKMPVSCGYYFKESSL